METVNVQKDLLVAVINYLGNQPFNQVAQLVMALQLTLNKASEEAEAPVPISPKEEPAAEPDNKKSKK